MAIDPWRYTYGQDGGGVVSPPVPPVPSGQGHPRLFGPGPMRFGPGYIPPLVRNGVNLAARWQAIKDALAAHPNQMNPTGWTDNAMRGQAVQRSGILNMVGGGNPGPVGPPVQPPGPLPGPIREMVLNSIVHGIY